MIRSLHRVARGAGWVPNMPEARIGTEDAETVFARQKPQPQAVTAAPRTDPAPRAGSFADRIAQRVKLNMQSPELRRKAMHNALLRRIAAEAAPAPAPVKLKRLTP